MVGAVIITHGDLSEALIRTAESITGEVNYVRAVSVNGTDSTEQVRESLVCALAEVDRKKGVIIFTDMFGGTPSNIALSFLSEGSVEVLTGVNLPLLLKFFNNRKGVVLSELLKDLLTHGQKSIILASEMLAGSKG